MRRQILGVREGDVDVYIEITDLTGHVAHLERILRQIDGNIQRPLVDLATNIVALVVDRPQRPVTVDIRSHCLQEHLHVAFRIEADITVRRRVESRDRRERRQAGVGVEGDIRHVGTGIRQVRK